MSVIHCMWMTPLKQEIFQSKTNNKLLNFSEWEENPTITTIESVTSPIEDLMFPTITLCPKNPNPDRWGPTIKLFDYMRQGCDPKG